MLDFLMQTSRSPQKYVWNQTTPTYHNRRLFRKSQANPQMPNPYPLKMRIAFPSAVYIVFNEKLMSPVAMFA